MFRPPLTPYGPSAPEQESNLTHPRRQTRSTQSRWLNPPTPGGCSPGTKSPGIDEQRVADETMTTLVRTRGTDRVREHDASHISMGVEIGRAAGRERVSQYVKHWGGAESVKKKKR